MLKRDPILSALGRNVRSLSPPKTERGSCFAGLLNFVWTFTVLSDR